MDVLERLIEEGIIDEVKGRLMSGKEASVFIVERDGVLLAAKVYKDLNQRTFKATADYTEGRNQTRNSRDKRAMGKRTKYGKELVEESWREMEYRALNEAFDAGVRVPEPVLLYDNVLLMELLVDEDGAPASRLAEFDLTAEVAELLHREIFGQVRLLLASGKVHGDLSAFNILITPAGPTLIDIPQVVDASSNNKAAEILNRDLKNITEHLARFNPGLMRFRDCGDVLWRHYQRDTLDRALAPEEGGHRSDGKRGRPGRDDRGRRARSHEDRANGGQRPSHDRPAGPRAGNDRPSSERQGQGPNERANERPPQPRQSGQRQSDGPPQSRPSGQRPNDRPPQVRPPQDRPAPRQDRPREDRPREDRPREDRPRQDRPRQDRPRQDRPPQDRASGQRPNSDRPPQDRPSGQRPGDDRPSGERAGREKPVTPASGDRPGNDGPGDGSGGSSRGRSRRRRGARGPSKAGTSTP